MQANSGGSRGATRARSPIDRKNFSGEKIIPYNLKGRIQGDDAITDMLIKDDGALALVDTSAD
jgi:hypothetical protein